MDFLPSHLPIPHNSHFPQLPSELIVRRGFLCNSYDELKKGTFTRMSLHNTLTAKQEENVYNVSQLGQPHVVDRLVYSKSKAVLRHFEQGHWRVFRLDTCNEKNIMASKFLFPGVLDPCASQSRYYCTLCESSYNQLYLLHSHALST
ncbi:unnamed protein product [Protopolystoma xenopodis]|uniref:Uncharacterized protein n=1 Tax=Protopolystoma xenopodis TaxID=117903 RepID=A0A3S5AFG2_9PLAT|nr:unnamed protein product [Protopolystoma xenopodis]